MVGVYQDALLVCNDALSNGLCLLMSLVRLVRTPQPWAGLLGLFKLPKLDFVSCMPVTYEERYNLPTRMSSGAGMTFTVCLSDPDTERSGDRQGEYVPEPTYSFCST